MHDPDHYWDPFFRACAETGTVVNMHIGSSSKMPSTSADAPPAVGSTLTHTNATFSMVDFMFSGVLVRFPDLKLAYAEGQIGWIPYILERADKVWEENRGWGGVADIVPEPPSTYFHRQIYGCFFDDAHGLRSVEEIGVDNITYESDYPHSDSTWPHTAEIAEKQMKDLTDEERYKILRGNAIELYGLDFDVIASRVTSRPMDLRYTDAEEAFRAELRAWLAEATVPSLPVRSPDPNDWPARRAYDTRWQRMLFDAGYAGVDWPVEGGGRGASPVEELIFKEELERAHAPYVGVNFVGLLHAGPTVIAEGTPEQRRRYLPPILRGDEVWCQGFSEPSAGSDLASLRTRAVRDGDDYVVTGSKIWTSHAEVADFCELLVRTGPEDSRHRGITWLILPMDTPGVDIRPLRTIAGSTEFAELFLDEVRVPVSQPGGRRERRVAGDHGHPQLRAGHRLRRRPARGLRAAGELGLPSPAGPAPGRTRASGGTAGHLRAELDALWALTSRNVSQAARTGIPGVGGTFFKLAYSETRNRLGEFSLDLLGRAGLAAGRSRGRRRTRGGAGRDAWSKTGCAASRSPSRPAPRRSSATSSAERILGLPKEPGDGLSKGRRPRTGSDREDASWRGHPPPVRGTRSRSSRSVHSSRPSGSIDRSGWRQLAEAGVFVSGSPRTPAASGSA